MSYVYHMKGVQGIVADEEGGTEVRNDVLC